MPRRNIKDQFKRSPTLQAKAPTTRLLEPPKSNDQPLSMRTFSEMNNEMKNRADMSLTHYASLLPASALARASGTRLPPQVVNLLEQAPPCHLTFNPYLQPFSMPHEPLKTLELGSLSFPLACKIRRNPNKREADHSARPLPSLRAPSATATQAAGHESYV